MPAHIDATNRIGHFPRKHKSGMKKEVVPIEEKKMDVSDVTIKVRYLNNCRMAAQPRDYNKTSIYRRWNLTA